MLKLIRQYDLDRLSARREKALLEIQAEHKKNEWEPIRVGFGGQPLPTDEILDRTLPRHVIVCDSPVPYWRRFLRFLRLGKE